MVVLLSPWLPYSHTPKIYRDHPTQRTMEIKCKNCIMFKWLYLQRLWNRLTYFDILTSKWKLLMSPFILTEQLPYGNLTTGVVLPPLAFTDNPGTPLHSGHNLWTVPNRFTDSHRLNSCNGFHRIYCAFGETVGGASRVPHDLSRTARISQSPGIWAGPK